MFVQTHFHRARHQANGGSQQPTTSISGQHDTHLKQHHQQHATTTTKSHHHQATESINSKDNKTTTANRLVAQLSNSVAGKSRASKQHQSKRTIHSTPAKVANNNNHCSDDDKLCSSVANSNRELRNSCGCYAHKLDDRKSSNAELVNSNTRRQPTQSAPRRKISNVDFESRSVIGSANNIRSSILHQLGCDCLEDSTNINGHHHYQRQHQDHDDYATAATRSMSNGVASIKGQKEHQRRQQNYDCRICERDDELNLIENSSLMNEKRKKSTNLTIETLESSKNQIQQQQFIQSANGTSSHLQQQHNTAITTAAKTATTTKINSNETRVEESRILQFSHTINKQDNEKETKEEEEAERIQERDNNNKLANLLFAVVDFVGFKRTLELLIDRRRRGEDFFAVPKSINQLNLVRSSNLLATTNYLILNSSRKTFEFLSEFCTNFVAFQLETWLQLLDNSNFTSRELITIDSLLSARQQQQSYPPPATTNRRLSRQYSISGTQESLEPLDMINQVHRDGGGGKQGHKSSSNPHYCHCSDCGSAGRQTNTSQHAHNAHHQHAHRHSHRTPTPGSPDHSQRIINFVNNQSAASAEQRYLAVTTKRPSPLRHQTTVNLVPQSSSGWIERRRLEATDRSQRHTVDGSPIYGRKQLSVADYDDNETLSVTLNDCVMGGEPTIICAGDGWAQPLSPAQQHQAHRPSAEQQQRNCATSGDCRRLAWIRVPVGESGEPLTRSSPSLLIQRRHTSNTIDSDDNYFKSLDSNPCGLLKSTNNSHDRGTSNHRSLTRASQFLLAQDPNTRLIVNYRDWSASSGGDDHDHLANTNHEQRQKNGRHRQHSGNENDKQEHYMLSATNSINNYSIDCETSQPIETRDRNSKSSCAANGRGLSSTSSLLLPTQQQVKKKQHQSPNEQQNKVSLAGARRRLGFKQKNKNSGLTTTGLLSLVVHRSEEIIPSTTTGDKQMRSLQNDQYGTSLDTDDDDDYSSSINLSAVDSYTNSSSLMTNSANAAGHSSREHEKQQHQLQVPTDESTARRRPGGFVEGLGVGQIASRQALVSPYLGDIQLSLSDQRGMLEVEIIRARNLQSKPFAKRLPSPYVKVYLMREKKCIAKFKTNQSKCTLDPLYQQRFIFRDNYSNCILQVIVWGDYGKKDRKSLMGLVQVHLDRLDISNVVVGWYKLVNEPSMASSISSSLMLSSKSLRQTISSSKIYYDGEHVIEQQQTNELAREQSSVVAEIVD